MKRLNLLIAFLALFSVVAYGQASNGFAKTKVHQPSQMSWQDFDQQNGKVQFVAGAGYFGSTISYFRKGTGRLMYGFNMDILPISTGVNAANDYFGAGLPGISQTSLLMPFWFSMKMRLTNRPASSISPYVIAGLGPAIGLRMENQQSFWDSISSINADLGGGGFAGIGVDYLWADEWAISADVRYMALDFDSPLRFSEDYSGLTFALGFVRAF